MEIIGVIIVFVLALIASALRSPSQKGRVGEAHASKELKKLPPEYVVLDDVVLKTNNGTTQIDHVVVSPYGIFGIETKNYRGELFGDDTRKEWTQIIKTDVTYRKKWWKTYTYVKKSRFYNPVKQSLGHILTLKDYLSDFGYIPMIPVVAFTDKAILSSIKSKYPVVYIEGLTSVILRYEKRYLSDEQVSAAVTRIQSINVSKKVTNKEHVHNIRNAALERNIKIANGVCPRCGGNLVLRQGGYGSFYGCSNYPRCRFTADK